MAKTQNNNFKAFVLRYDFIFLHVTYSMHGSGEKREVSEFKK